MTPSHIPSVQLALFAGGDLPFWTRVGVERHVAQCDDCAALVREYARQQLDLAQRAEELPPSLTGVAWQSLASEMTANIRLGLAAGACVSAPVAARVRPKLTFALAGLAVILSIIAVERPRLNFGPRPAVAPAPELAGFVPMLEGTGSSVGIRNGGRELSVTAPVGIDEKSVIRTVNARGEIGSRYVEDTGVTVVNIYAE
ncbi:anti-sigma factor family protein [Nevskia soli]|jgi:hypothetical protein|uniref:anti-sigma factor family protein n=1 Tax=Nevskia soli TaxID=418856 RepID=UPI0015D8F4C5|nr:hypothetical protein [Nevskia soli]